MNNKFLSVFIILFVYSCGEPAKVVETQEEFIPSVIEHPAGFLIGNDIDVWENQTEAAPENKLLLTLNNDVNINVIVLGTDDKYKNIINPINKSPLLSKVRFDFNDMNHEGWVDSKYIFSDPEGKILYGVSDSREDRVLLQPPLYSVSSNLSPKTYKGSDGEETTLSYCQIYDSALVFREIYYTEILKGRGEFETREEHKNRVDLLTKVANSNNWNKRIYVSGHDVSRYGLNFDLDTETFSIELDEIIGSFESSIGDFDSWMSHGNYQPYEEDKDVISSWSSGGAQSQLNYFRIDANGGPYCGMSFNLPYGQVYGSGTETFDGGEHNFRIDPRISEYGDFSITNKGGTSIASYGKYEGELVYSDREFNLNTSFKIPKADAKFFKEGAEESPQKPFKLIYGFRPNTIQFASQYQRCEDRYDTGYETCTSFGGFSFLGTMEFIILIDSFGSIYASYFSEIYQNEYLDNDLYIQEVLSKEQDLKVDLSSLDKKQKLAKLFSLQYFE